MPDTMKYQDVHVQHSQQIVKLQQNGKNKFLLLNPIKRLAGKQIIEKIEVADNVVKRSKPLSDMSHSNEDQQKYYSYNKNNERTVFKHLHSSFLIMPDSVIEKHERDTEILQAYLNEKNTLLNVIEKAKFDRHCLTEMIDLINKFLVKYYMLMNENFDLNIDLIYFKNLREKILKEMSKFEQKPSVFISPASSQSNSPSPSSSSSSTQSTQELNTNLMTFCKPKQQDQAYQQSIVVNHQSSPILKKATSVKQPKTVTFNNNIALITQFDDDVDGNNDDDNNSCNNLDEAGEDEDDDHGEIINRLMKKIHLDKNYQRPSVVNIDNKCELCCQSSVSCKISEKYCENCYYYMKTKFNLQN